MRALASTADLATTSNKFLFVDAPSLDDGDLERTFSLRSFTGHEGISRLFSFDLDLYSKDPNIDFEKIVGQNISVGFTLADGVSMRVFNGVVSRFVQLPTDGRAAHYQAEMVPWLWFLDQSANCRIFANMTVPEIVLEVIRDFGFQDVQERLRGNYTKWEYCVQYRETALNFVMRLMQQEGIFFFFEHGLGRHTLVLADARSALATCTGDRPVLYRPPQGEGASCHHETVCAWVRKQEFRPGRYTIKDFNYETPRDALLSTIETQGKLAGSRNYEIYDYPGEYEKPEEGEAWARMRMEEEELEGVIMTGESDARSFAPGFQFQLSGFERFEPSRYDQNGHYLLTSVSHDVNEGGLSSGDIDQQAAYKNVFTCIPSSVSFRPRRLAPKPLIQGSQTAIVVGPDGEEIYTDEYGRVKVQFHWDRRGRRNESSSCWIRVAQPWAGGGWGAIYIPRVGDEVVVGFLEGDPDRPIITGCVYNRSRMPPYKLPDNQTQSGIRSRSAKGGETDHYNEIRFEDKKGSEEVFIQAERNMTTVIGSDQSHRVGHDRCISVGNDENTKVRGSRTVDIDSGHQTLTVHTGNRTVNVNTGDDTLKILTGNQEVDVNTGHATLNVSSGNRDVNVAAGGYQLKANRVIVQAMEDLTLQCGTGIIKIDAAGNITINGAIVRINS